MNFVDVLNYLDQLKDYVQTSLSTRENVQQQTTIVQKVEQFDHFEGEDEHSEDIEQIGGPSLFSEKIDERNKEENRKAVQEREETETDEKWKQHGNLPSLEENYEGCSENLERRINNDEG